VKNETKYGEIRRQASGGSNRGAHRNKRQWRKRHESYGVAAKRGGNNHVAA